MTDNVTQLPTAAHTEVINGLFARPHASRHSGLFGTENVIITHGLFKGREGVINLYAATRDTHHPARDKRRGRMLQRLLKVREERAAARADEALAFHAGSCEDTLNWLHSLSEPRTVVWSSGELSEWTSPRTGAVNITDIWDAPPGPEAA